MIIGEATRFKRTNTNKEDYDHTITQLNQHLSDRDYPHQLIEDTLKRVTFDQTTANPNPRPNQTNHPLLFRTSYSRQSKSIKDTLMKNWHLITNSDLAPTFPQEPLLSFHGARTLANTLVRAKLPGDQPTTTEDYETSNQIKIDPRTPHCKVKTCKTCPKILPLRQLNGFPLTQNLNCKTQNVIYAIQCCKCKKLYIGQTSKPLHLRITNHRTAARTHTNWPIYRHFSTNNHQFERDHRVIIEATNKNLLEREKTWIRRLNTTLPNGLNSQYSLL